MTRDTPPLPATPEVCRTPPRFCPEGVGVGLPTIWREAAATPVNVLYSHGRGVWICCRCPADRGQAPLPRPAARIKSARRIGCVNAACGQNRRRSAYRLYQSGLQSESKALGVSVVEVGALGAQPLRHDAGYPASARNT